MKKKIAIRKLLIPSILLVVGVAIGVGITVGGMKGAVTGQQQTINKHHEFLKEIFDLILENHWEKLTEQQLSELYGKALEKISGSLQPKPPQNWEDVQKIVDGLGNNLDDSQKTQLAAELSNMVLANLKPFGRSGLFGKKQEEQLKNTVSNINPESDLYETIGVEKNTSKESLDKTYEEQVAILAEETKTSTAAAAKLEKIKYAYEVLADDQSREIYDTYGAEPTVFSRLLTDNVYYMKITKISPSTFEEIKRAAEKSGAGSKPSELIIDVRGNIGGAIDTLAFILGPFIGNNQYAYEFFHQGEYTPYKTRVGWLDGLVKFDKVVLLTDSQAQSSAEVITATFKKYNVGTVVGTTTKGWGTIEKVFKLKSELATSQGYSVFLVHSLTVGENGQPIEGNGVAPHIDVANSNWKQQLAKKTGSTQLVTEVEKLLSIK